MKTWTVFVWAVVSAFQSTAARQRDESAKVSGQETIPHSTLHASQTLNMDPTITKATTLMTITASRPITSINTSYTDISTEAIYTFTSTTEQTINTTLPYDVTSTLAPEITLPTTSFYSTTTSVDQQSATYETSISTTIQVEPERRASTTITSTLEETETTSPTDGERRRIPTTTSSASEETVTSTDDGARRKAPVTNSSSAEETSTITSSDADPQRKAPVTSSPNPEETASTTTDEVNPQRKAATTIETITVPATEIFTTSSVSEETEVVESSASDILRGSQVTSFPPPEETESSSKTSTTVIITSTYEPPTSEPVFKVKTKTTRGSSQTQNVPIAIETIEKGTRRILQPSNIDDVSQVIIVENPSDNPIRAFKVEGDEPTKTSAGDVLPAASSTLNLPPVNSRPKESLSQSPEVTTFIIVIVLVGLVVSAGIVLSFDRIRRRTADQGVSLYMTNGSNSYTTRSYSNDETIENAISISKLYNSRDSVDDAIRISRLYLPGTRK